MLLQIKTEVFTESLASLDSLVGFFFPVVCLFFPSEYISLIEILSAILHLQGIYFLCSYRENFYSSCCLQADLHTVSLIAIQEVTEISSIWITMDVFINLNLSKVTSKIFPKINFFVSCPCQVISSR